MQVVRQVPVHRGIDVQQMYIGLMQIMLFRESDNIMALMQHLKYQEREHKRFMSMRSMQEGAVAIPYLEQKTLRFREQHSHQEQIIQDRRSALHPTDRLLIHFMVQQQNILRGILMQEPILVQDMSAITTDRYMVLQQPICLPEELRLHHREAFIGQRVRQKETLVIRQTAVEAVTGLSSKLLIQMELIP